MTKDQPSLVERLRATPNWQRESFEHWKTATFVYDRAPFEAADELERLTAELAAERGRWRADALTYRWMTANRLGWFSRMSPLPLKGQTKKDALDAAIHLAMKEQP